LGRDRDVVVGLMLGIPLALAARVGPWPKVAARQLVRPLAIMLMIVGALATAAGLVGHAAAARRWVWLLEPLASRIPPDRHVSLITDLWAHLASYAGGFLGGIVLTSSCFVAGSARLSFCWNLHPVPR
jgi:hypothetical protein